MKKFLIIALLSLTTGCLNLYTRCPGTDSKIKSTYQCTHEMLGWTIITAFPQALDLSDTYNGFQWFNCLTIPLAIIPAVDMCLESVVDTVCYPFDTSRKSK